MKIKEIQKIVKRTLTLYSQNDMSVYAGYATLFVITAIFPLLMLVISVVSMIPGFTPKTVTEFLLQVLPNLESIRDMVISMVSNLQDQSGGLLASVAALTTLWSASGGVAAMQKGLKKITPDAVHHAARDRAITLGYTLIFVILFPAMILFEMLGDTIIDIVTGIAMRMVDTMADHVGGTFAIDVDDITSKVTTFIEVSSLATAVGAVLFILLTYAYLPGGRRSVRAQLPGAIFTAVSWFLFTQLFSFFIPRFYHSSGIYGSLASMFLALLWLRFIMTIFFLGGALNQAISYPEGVPAADEPVESGVVSPDAPPKPRRDRSKEAAPAAVSRETPESVGRRRLGTTLIAYGLIVGTLVTRLRSKH